MRLLSSKRAKIAASLVLFLVLFIVVILALQQLKITQDRQTFFATSSTTTAPLTSQEYYRIPKPTRELPEEMRNHRLLQGRKGYTSYGDAYGNLYVQVFHATAPVWDCDLYFIKGNTVISLSRARPKFLSCLDLYTDGQGGWYAVDPGYVGINGETRVYRLQQDNVIKIYGLEELRGLDLYFDTKQGQWYGSWALAGATEEDISTEVWHTINFPLLAGDTPYTPKAEAAEDPRTTSPIIQKQTRSTTTPPIRNSTGTTSPITQSDPIETLPPEPFPAAFISSVLWPPVIATSSKMSATKPFTCDGTTSTKRRIGAREYCITITTEGAAGSVYKNFTYDTETATDLITASFVLRFPNCQNFDSPTSETCAAEQATIDIDSLVVGLIE